MKATYGIIGVEGDGISGVDEDYLRTWIAKMWSMFWKVPSFRDIMLFCNGELGTKLVIGDTGYVAYRSEIG